MGENVRFKALVGLTSLAADEKTSESDPGKEHWFERAKWPAPNEDTGAQAFLSSRKPVLLCTSCLLLHCANA